MIEDEEDEELISILKQYRQQISNEHEEQADQNERSAIEFVNVNINAQDYNGWTPLITALINRVKNIKGVTKIFMELGYDPFIMSKCGKNAFHWATRTGNDTALRTIVKNWTRDQVNELLNTETKDRFKLKPLILAAKHDQVDSLSYLMELEQKNRTTCIHNTYQANENGEKEYKRLCGKCFAVNNLYMPDKNGDTIMHHIIREGSQKVYKFMISVFLKSNTSCSKLIGDIDAEKEGTKSMRSRINSNDLSNCEDEYQISDNSEALKDYLMVDGDTISTDERDDSDSNNQEKTKPILLDIDGNPVEKEDHSSIIFTQSESIVIRKKLIEFFSHQNKLGNTVLHEAVIEDRTNFIESLQLLQMVRQNICNKQNMTFEQLNNYLTINEFTRRYQNAVNQAKSRKRKKRRCSFWDSEDDYEEESWGLIKVQKIVSNQERLKREHRAFMMFAFLFVFVLVWIFSLAIYYAVNMELDHPTSKNNRPHWNQ